MLQRKSRLNQQKSPQQRFLFVLGLFFFLAYLALGLMVMFWEQLPLSISRNGRIAFGILLIVYAFFRFVRLIQNYNRAEE